MAEGARIAFSLLQFLAKKVTISHHKQARMGTPQLNMHCSDNVVMLSGKHSHNIGS